MKKNGLIDFWSDHNRGDAMMQVALVQLLAEEKPSIFLDSGVNEYKRFSVQLDEINKIVCPQYFSGIKFSFFFRSTGKFFNLVNKALLILNPIMSHIVFLLWVMGLKVLIPKNLKLSLDRLKSTDTIYWNGRNFRGNSSIIELFEFIDLSMTIVFAIYLKKRIYALGVSVWSPKSFFGKCYLKWLMNSCTRVYARESYSKIQLSNIGVLNVNLIPDLSFYYMINNIKKDRFVPVIDTTDTFNIGIVCKDPVKRNNISTESYVSFIVTFVKMIELKTDKTIKVKFINQAVVDNEADDFSKSMLISAFRSEGYIVDTSFNRNPSLLSLFEDYANLDYLVSSRMHACISSAYFNIPMLGIPYDSGAKWNILKDNGDFKMINMEDIPGFPASSIDKLFDDDFDMSSAISKGAQQLQALFDSLKVS